MSISEEHNYRISATDKIMIVMGLTGAGKSTFIEYATQQSGGTIGHGLQSHTSEIRAVRAKHPKDKGFVVFVDTPGFNNTKGSDIGILGQIAVWCINAYKEQVPICIIYLHRISDNRLAIKNLQAFATMCGQEAMPRVVLATTMWSETTTDTGAQREKELKELKGTFWAEKIARGCAVKRFEDSYQSAWEIVDHLTTEQENIILFPKIYDDKKHLNETVVDQLAQANILSPEIYDNRRHLDETAIDQLATDQTNIIISPEIYDDKKHLHEIAVDQLGTEQANNILSPEIYDDKKHPNETAVDKSAIQQESIIISHNDTAADELWEIISPPEDPKLFDNGRSSPEDPKYKLSADDRIIVVMGPTGAGKSTFIEYATQQSGESVGHRLQSETSAIRAVRTKHPDDNGSVIFVDTPGFDDTNRSDIAILAQIAGWFVKVYKEKVPLSAIVYLHRISDNRMAGSPLKNLQMFASMCGQGAMPRVVLATTMWSETKAATGERREAELQKSFWADMIAQGSAVRRFEDSYPSAWQIVGKLPMVQENVILSREIYDDKKNLNETAAGLKLTEELNKSIADQKEAARRLEEQVHSQHNPIVVAQLRLEKDEIKEKIGGVTAQLQQLKVPFGRKVMNFIAGKKARKSGVYVPGNR